MPARSSGQRAARVRRLSTLPRWLLAAAAVPSLLTSQLEAAGDPTDSRPNVVLILADDLGFDDLAIHGNPIVKTPRIDALAREAVRFSSFYVTPLGAPTRAALLTGRDHLRTGVAHVGGGKDFLSLQERTLAEAFRAAGYATGMWGTWHLGTTDGYHPWQRGFDEAYSAVPHRHQNGSGRLNGEPREHEGWTDAALTDYAIDFMRRHQERRFFAYLPYLACHAPLEAPEPSLARYRGQRLREPLATLYGMVEHLDTQVGRLLDEIDRLGLAKKTVIVFLSDNGPWVGTDTLTAEDHKTRYVNGLRGHRGDLWENGILSPLFVRCKSRFAPRVVERLVDVTDIFPTLLELAGGDASTSHPVDGRSIVPYLRGETEALDERVLFRYAHPGWLTSERPSTPEGVPNEYAPVDRQAVRFAEQTLAIRTERYKLLLNPRAADHEEAEPDEDLLLFDLRADRREQKDLSASQPALLATLRDRLASWFDGIVAEPQAFATPTYLVGLEGARSNDLPASGPSRLQGNLVNTLGYLTGWTAPGDVATYHLKVLTPGRYRVSLEHEWRERSYNVLFRLSAGSAPSQLRLLVGREQIPALLELPAGEGPLTLSLYRGAPGGKELGLRLTRILLEREDP
jgi:arylsulfatase A-like enzyme